MRRGRALLLAVVVPGLLLGGGWLWASVREQRGLARERQALLERQATVIRAAVDEGLEELRRREDARPFYLYNHFYSPPDVLALADPVARSPLAGGPDDPRVVGHLQVDPGPIVRTPYSPHAGPSTLPLERRLFDGIDAGELATLARWAEGDPEEVLLAQKGTEVANKGSVKGEPIALSSDVGNAYTVSLNQWSNQLAEDLLRYQSDSSSSSSQQVFKQQRAAPRLGRKNVGPSEQEVQVATLPGDAEQQAQQESPAFPEKAQQASALPSGRLDDDERQAAGPGATTRPPAGDPARPGGPRLGGVERDRRPQQDVEYTPMRFRPVGDEVFLVRTVAHGGITSVQAARLDLPWLRERWIPELLSRHAVGEHPRVVPSAALDETCALRVAASAVVPGADLCFDDAGGAPASLLTGLGLQGGLLALFLGVLFGAALLLSRAERQARELAEQQARFVSAVSHELRTPLTTIRMNAEMLAEGLVAPAKQQVFLERQATESVRLSHLVENVLEIARLDAGRRPSRREPGDLADVLGHVVEQQRSFLASRGAEVRLLRPDEAPATFDRPAVEQIVVNLLDNAAKYGAPTGGEGARIDVSLTREGAGWVLRVDDAGPGIGEADREKVFERFFRARRDDDRHVVGTGLGLALVRDLARSQGGDARVTASPAGGCRVEIHLPAG